jgi:hypothetical protein
LAAGPARTTGADLAGVQLSADQVLLLGDPAHTVVHWELESNWTGLADVRRLLACNALLHRLHELPVHSVVILLRRSANSPQLTGTYTVTTSPFHKFVASGGAFGLVRR